MPDDRKVSAAANAMNEECSKGELIDMLLKSRGEVRELKGQVDELSCALAKFGNHDPECNSFSRYRGGGHPCNCGFSEAEEIGEENG